MSSEQVTNVAEVGTRVWLVLEDLGIIQFGQIKHFPQLTPLLMQLLQSNLVVGWTEIQEQSLLLLCNLLFYQSGLGCVVLQAKFFEEERFFHSAALLREGSSLA